MARVLWLNWSGGGNLPPSLGIARVLSERGHAVSFAGRPEMVPRVERAGFRAIEFTRAYEQAAAYPPNKWLPKAASYLTSPAMAEEIRALVDAERPDLVAIDAMFPAALIEAERFDCPSAVMLHTCVYRMLEPWKKMLGLLADLRAEAGFGPWPSSLDELWMRRDRLVVTTVKALDTPVGGLAHSEKVRHVGPVLEREPHMRPIALPWAQDERPLVLVSFSTMPEQGSVAKFQKAIDALRELPVYGVVTTGHSIDPGALKPADNVAVFANADHDQLMQRASLVVTHGGHGTFMRALSYGLPMAIIPGLASDQPVHAASAQAWGAGLALPNDASAEAMRSAVATILADPSYRAAAARLAKELEGLDGASGAANELEQLLPRAARRSAVA